MIKFIVDNFDVCSKYRYMLDKTIVMNGKKLKRLLQILYQYCLGFLHAEP